MKIDFRITKLLTNRLIFNKNNKELKKLYNLSKIKKNNKGLKINSNKDLISKLKNYKAKDRDNSKLELKNKRIDNNKVIYKKDINRYKRIYY